MRAVPVCSVLCRRSIFREESLWSEWEEGKEAGQLCSVEVKSVVEHFHIGQEVNESYALQGLLAKVLVSEEFNLHNTRPSSYAAYPHGQALIASTQPFLFLPLLAFPGVFLSHRHIRPILHHHRLAVRHG